MHINDLNDDALLQIFMILSREDVNGAFMLLPVCARWESLALQSPSLWRYFTLADDIEDLEARLHICTALAPDLPLVVRALVPVHPRNFMIVLNHRVLRLDIYSKLRCRTDMGRDISAIYYPLGKYRTVNEVLWYGDKKEPQVIDILYSSDHYFDGALEDLPSSFTKVLRAHPPVLLTDICISDRRESQKIPGHIFMRCIQDMPHLRTLAIREETLHWEKAEAPQYTFPLLEQLDYYFTPSARTREPRLSLILPKLSHLQIATSYTLIPLSMRRFTGFKALYKLRMTVVELTIPSDSFASAVTSISHIAFFQLDLSQYDRAGSFEKQLLGRIDRGLAQISKNVIVGEWSISVNTTGLRCIDWMRVPFSSVNLVCAGLGSRAEDAQIPVATTGEATPERRVYDLLCIETSFPLNSAILSRLPAARRMIVSCGALSQYVAIQNDFPGPLTTYLRELYVDRRCYRPFLGVRGEPKMHRFTSLTRLHVPLGVAEMLITRNQLPTLEELVILSRKMDTEAELDESLEIMLKLFLQRFHQGLVLARLHTLGVDWWPQWDLVEMFLVEWRRRQKMDRVFTLKLPSRPQILVLESLVDILNGRKARHPLPATSEHQIGVVDGFCWKCFRSGYKCNGESHPIRYFFEPDELFGVTKNTYLGEFE